MIENVSIIALFIAGNLMFLAPCTLPLVPGYIGLISGVSVADLQDPNKRRASRGKILINGASFIVGFSAVFIAFGVLIGMLGAEFASARDIILRVSGLVVIAFGLSMIGILKLPFLAKEARFSLPKNLERGKPTTSTIIGAAFGAGWTPCAGPALGTALGLVADSGTAAQGAIALAIFSLGLAVPFMLMAVFAGWALEHMQSILKIIRVTSIIGGVFFIGMGWLLLTDNVHLMSEWSFKIFDWLGLEFITEYL